MITIGIRASPRTLTFAVYDTATQAVLNVEEIRLPAAFDKPDALKYARSNLLDVLREYRVERAGVRVTEPNADPNIDRVQLEGVIQEVFASSNLAGYYIGQIASISARIGIARTSFRPHVDGVEDYPVENWDATSKEGREAILTAIGAANA